MRRQKTIIFLFFALALAACALFLFWNLSFDNMEYNLPRRLVKLAAFALTGGAIGVSTVVFQTVTQNRILTPSIMGLDSLYVFIQTMLVFFMGSTALAQMSSLIDYSLSLGCMMLLSLILFKLLFQGENRQITTIILAGIVFGSLFGSLSTFMQVIIDPNEFGIIESRMFASFNRINTSLLGFSAVLIISCLAYLFFRHRRLDVMNLGEEISINLGINYQARVTQLMLVISLLTAASTALVGPITFLGLITANLARQLLQTHRHTYNMLGAFFISVFALALGQFFVERIFNFSTTISVIINFIGGIYFILLMLREAKVKSS